MWPWHNTPNADFSGFARTRFGQVTYTLQARSDGSVLGSVELAPPAAGGAKVAVPMVAVKIRSADASKPLAGTVAVAEGAGGGGGATLVAWHPGNETAVFKLGVQASASGLLSFNFTAR